MSVPDLKLLARVLSAINHPAMIREVAEIESVSEIGPYLLTFGLAGRDALISYIANVREQYPDADLPDGAEWWEAHFDDRAGNPQKLLDLARKFGWSDDPLDIEKKVITAKPIGRELQRSGKGAPLSNTYNAVLELEAQRIISVFYDTFLGRVMVQRDDEDARPLADTDVTEIQTDLQARGLSTLSSSATRDAIHLVARKYERDCLVEDIERTQWDGEPRLTYWVSKVLGVEQNRYHAHAGRNFLKAAVARAYRPGCKVDECLILEGPQGAGKSQVFEVLGGLFYAELTADPRSKDFEQQLRGVWIAIFSELSVLNRADNERLKQFITCRADHYRPSYGRETQDYPRRCVFGGTTNSGEWLHDPTGGRRFIPIAVGKIDLEWLRENRDQLFAEAVVLFKRNPKWWYFPREQTLAAQSARMPDDPWLGPIRDYLYGRHTIVNVGDVLQHALDMPADKQTRTHSIRVGMALKNLGCEQQSRRRIEGELRRPWTVPEQYASKPCRRTGPAPTGAAAFDPLLSVTAPTAACELI